MNRHLTSFKNIRRGHIKPWVNTLKTWPDILWSSTHHAPFVFLVLQHVSVSDYKELAGMIKALGFSCCEMVFIFGVKGLEKEKQRQVRLANFLLGKRTWRSLRAVHGLYDIVWSSVWRFITREFCGFYMKCLSVKYKYFVTIVIFWGKKNGWKIY